LHWPCWRAHVGFVCCHGSSPGSAAGNALGRAAVAVHRGLASHVFEPCVQRPARCGSGLTLEGW
jgi:hypothetical protein